MGDCASRPSRSEIEEHLNDSNSKNDRFFKMIPYADDQQRLISLEINQNILEGRKYLFDKKYKEFSKKSESISKNSHKVQEFLIEVQKATNINQTGFCFNMGKPFVTVSLEPNGPSESTFPADYFRPKWYKMINFKTLLNFQSVKFEVNIENSGKTLGNFSIKIKDLESQDIISNWFPLGSSSESSLKIRIQYIKDEILLYKSLEKRCLNCIDEIDDVIRKLSSLAL